MLPYRGAGSLRAERLREAERSLDVYGQLGARQGAAAAAARGVPRLGDPVQGGPQPAGDVAQRVEVSTQLLLQPGQGVAGQRGAEGGGTVIG